MSVSFYKIFSNAFRLKLPRLQYKTSTFSVLPGTWSFNLHIRQLTVMNTVASEECDNDIIPSKKLTRFRKRQWEPSEKQQSDESDTKKLCDTDNKPVVERIKRKKMAMLLGYCGVDYFGMQRNPGVRTIEEDLLKALFDCKYITEDDFKNQQNAQFQRSSRTDKGVSAARQVVSLKMPLDVSVEEINKRLPECIRVFGIKRVTNKFNSKGKCNARTYSYTLPTFVFEPSLQTLEEKKQYRIPPEKLEQINKVLGVYKGTKSYHNFTEKKYHTDPSSSRFMMSFGVEKVFVDSDMEFAVLLVKGQSFMLHQIRKMVGLMIAVLRGHTDMSMMERAFAKEKLMIPTAPGLGLVLDMVHYDRYDARFKSSHDSLTWEEAEDTIQKFKHEHIYPVIVKGELQDKSMDEWLVRRLEVHSYEPNDDRSLDKDEQKDIEIGGGDDDEDDDIVKEIKTTVNDQDKGSAEHSENINDVKDNDIHKETEEAADNCEDKRELASNEDSNKNKEVDKTEVQNPVT